MQNVLRPALGDRAMFPSLTARAYLAHAAISPPSVTVERAIFTGLTAYASKGALAFGSAVEQRNRLRANLAKLLGAELDGVALIPNTSAGVTCIALGLPWRRGDRVLLFEGEFPANTTPWQRAAELFGLELRWHSADLFRTDPTRAFEALDRELAAGVRLVALSQVQFQTGHRMPLAEVAARTHRHGAELFVDAIQGLGAVPLDVVREGVDYLASGSHKWLMGTEGCGVLYARPSLASALRPHVAGWLSHEAPFRFLAEGAGLLTYDRPLRARADVFEGGTPNALGCFALEASTSLLLELGVGAIHTHVNAYLDALEAGLVARGFESLRSASPEARSCILGVIPPKARGPKAPVFQRMLGERGVTTSVPDGVLRFAPHWPNDAREVPEVLRAVDDVLGA
jgi:cysteine desulfurase / selenocysteine lyase